MMTDELVKRLRYLSRVFRKHDVEELTYNDYLSARLYPDEAADRIEALTAERDEMAMSCLSADGEAQRAWDKQKAAEAERDRLREALGKLECKCSSNCDWQRDDVCPSWIARAALKGETP